MPAEPKWPAIAGDALVGRAFCDVMLIGVAWKEEGVDLELELPDRKVADSGLARLSCRLLYSMNVSLDLSKNPGAPLSWDGEVSRRASGGYRVLLDFGNSGEIAIECEQLALAGSD